MSDVKQLIKERAIIKARLTRFKNYFNTVKCADGLPQLKLRFARFEVCYTEFDAVQSQIELVDESEECVSERVSLRMLISVL